MIVIEVKLYALLHSYRPADAPGAPHKPFLLMLPDFANVETAVSQLNIPDGFVNVAALNDDVVDLDTPLKDGDKVGLFPPAAGGVTGQSDS